MLKIFLIGGLFVLSFLILDDVSSSKELSLMNWWMLFFILCAFAIGYLKKTLKTRSKKKKTN